MKRLAIGFVLLFFGCRASDSDPTAILLPAASEIDAIEIRFRSGPEPQIRRLVDPTRIERFVKFINERRDGWRRPVDTMPSGEFDVKVMRQTEIAAVFWPGPSYIGGRQWVDNKDSRSNRLCSLSEAEWSELCEILEIADEDL